MSDNVCLYHGGFCSDGFASAYAVNEYLIYSEGDTQCKFIAMQYGDKIPDVTNKNVYIVDFSFPRDDIIKMHSIAKSLIVIDHHKVAEANLRGLDYCYFDMNRAGCVLTWETLFKGVKPVPTLLLYVQDRDLWKWILPKSAEVSVALRSYPLDFEIWDNLMQSDISKLQKEGEHILRYSKMQIEDTIKGGFQEMRIGGHIVPVINTKHFISEIGNRLIVEYPDYPFAATYFDREDGMRVFSLRSTDNHMDVSGIAKQYGGGGHRNASGFIIEPSRANTLFKISTLTLKDVSIIDDKSNLNVTDLLYKAIPHILETCNVEDISKIAEEKVSVDGNGTLTVSIDIPSGYTLTTTVNKNDWIYNS